MRMSTLFQLSKAFWFMALLAVLSLTAVKSHASALNDDSSAVVLAYHRINEDTYPETNLKLDQFLSHIQEIIDGEYNVMPLPEILDALEAEKSLPPQTIAITFEGGYKSAYATAMQSLVEKRLPFTVFFSSNQAGRNASQYMNWEDLLSLQKTGLVTFGILPASYERLSAAPRAEILSQINSARTRFRDVLGEEAALFSYPFGEYSLNYKELVEEQGFRAAFGLHSGAVYAESDLFSLPRFPMTENFGSIDRFKLVAQAKPFVAHDIEPKDPYLNTNEPSIGFSVSDQFLDNLKNLSCFVSGQGKVRTEKLGTGRVEIRLNEPLFEERTRINCTIPVKEKEQTIAWRWFGMLLINHDDIIPQQDELP